MSGNDHGSKARGRQHAAHDPAPRSPSKVFSPLQLRDVRFPNRIVIGPMQTSVAGADGLTNDWHFQHLAKHAVGGAGTVMIEALIVDPIGGKQLRRLRYLVGRRCAGAQAHRRVFASPGRPRGGAVASLWTEGVAATSQARAGPPRRRGHGQRRTTMAACQRVGRGEPGRLVATAVADDRRDLQAARALGVDPGFKLWPPS
jgi:2,4-dienoyl-CoA reductase-like NADH-dependent reductase (Old Yellow Enzyme family)